MWAHLGSVAHFWVWSQLPIFENFEILSLGPWGSVAHFWVFEFWKLWFWIWAREFLEIGPTQRAVVIKASPTLGKQWSHSRSPGWASGGANLGYGQWLHRFPHLGDRLWLHCFPNLGDRQWLHSFPKLGNRLWLHRFPNLGDGSIASPTLGIGYGSTASPTFGIGNGSTAPPSWGSAMAPLLPQRRDALITTALWAGPISKNSRAQIQNHNFQN